MPQYNLLYERWLPFTTVDGEEIVVGIAEALINSHNLRNMSFHHSLFEGGMMRILLAILHRAGFDPENKLDFQRIYSDGQFEQTKLHDYFKKVENRFDLFDKEKPFFQTANLKMEKDSLSLKLFFPEITSGHNKTLFNHSLDKDVLELTYAEAAAGLIICQYYSLGGLYKKSTNLFGLQSNLNSASLVRGIPVYATGDTLFETLALNLLIHTDTLPIPATDKKKDLPVWERDDLEKPGKIAPYGYMHILAPKNRHILLEEENGRVTGMHMADGEIPDAEQFVDPFFLRVKNAKGEMYSKQLDPERSLWRDSLALFTKETCSYASGQLYLSYPEKSSFLNLTAYAIANDKANPLQIRKDELKFSASILHDEKASQKLSNAMELALKIHKHLGTSVWLYFDVLFAHTSKESQKQKRSANNAQQLFWGELQLPFYEFCSDIEKEDSLTVWKNVLKETALNCFLNSKGIHGRGVMSTHCLIESESILKKLLNEELDV